jgi:hypothetical protein
MSGAGLVIQKGRDARTFAFALSLAALFAAFAGGGCGGSSPSGPDAAAGAGGTAAGGAPGSAGSTGTAGTTGAGGAAAGAVTFSCYVPNSLCTQLLVQPSGVAAEQTQCTNLQSGTSGTGCPTAGIIGCCQPKAGDASHEEQCYYDATEASLEMGLCKTTWTTTL